MNITETPLLPLLADQTYSQPNTSNRRHKLLKWAVILRYIARRRLKFYLIAVSLLVILGLTIVHRLYIDGRIVTNQTKRARNHKLQGRIMKTVIGRYVGPRPPWAEPSSANLSHEILNTNNYDPDPTSGKDGRPVYLPDYPKSEMEKLYSINRFNLVASDKISVDRKLPDPRKFACKKKIYDIKELPNTSVIIVFHNEAWSTLVRTVHSIINTAPQHLIAEIMLVDDASNRTFLGKSLEYYMNNLGSMRGTNIKLIRSVDRIGLIKARLLGVAEAKGEVLTFIDAHCEATKGWLEPLLEQVKHDRKSAACPIIDIINDNTFAFTRSFELHFGAFNWGLNFRWYPISRRELIESNGYHPYGGSKVKFTELIHPFSSPVMAGGLFSISKEYFNQIGGYDTEMDIWGGENIELSLRLWQCGGNVKIVPCSHVGHIFRKSSPYTFRPGKEVGDILYTNLARVSEVWMDDWKNFFRKMNPVVNRTIDRVGRDNAFKNIDERKKLRQDLKCNTFDWFLREVWPENFFPNHDRSFGKLKNSDFNKCLQRPTIKIGLGQASVGAIDMANCSDMLAAEQLFVVDKKKGLIMTDENVCLDSGSDPIPTRQVILTPCSESTRQKWTFEKSHRLKHSMSGLCLQYVSQVNKVQLQTCHENNPGLGWLLVDEPWT